MNTFDQSVYIYESNSDWNSSSFNVAFHWVHPLKPIFRRLRTLLNCLWIGRFWTSKCAYTMLCLVFTAALSDAPFTMVLKSPTGSWIGKSMIANISAVNKYQPNIHAANANPPPIWMLCGVSRYIRSASGWTSSHVGNLYMSINQHPQQKSS